MFDASFREHKELIELLIDNGANVNARNDDDWILGGASPLFSPAQQGHTEIVELLIKRGADINLTNKSGRTALDGAWGPTDALLRKHGGKTGEELKAEGK